MNERYMVRILYIYRNRRRALACSCACAMRRMRVVSNPRTHVGGDVCVEGGCVCATQRNTRSVQWRHGWLLVLRVKQVCVTYHKV